MNALVTLLKPAAGDTISLLNHSHKSYLALPRQERIPFFADTAKRARLAEDAGPYPLPVAFVWHAEGCNAGEYTLHVSRQSDFASEVAVTTRETVASVYNLRIHCLYFWKVTAVLAEGRTVASPVRTFQTADEPPRLLRIDGLPNTRDLGGRKTADGKRVKQDMIFRCSALNEGSYPIYEDEEDVLNRDHGRLRPAQKELASADLTKQNAHDEQTLATFANARVIKGWVPAGPNRLSAEMKSYMLDSLHIRTDIDLRWDHECHGMTGSPLGASVAWVRVSFYQYGGMVDKEGKGGFAKAFKVLCDEKNYPLIFHCAAGRDRTGSLAFILNGLLAVDEEELYRDWEATGFWDKEPFCHESRFMVLVNGLKEAHPWATWQETLQAYVKCCGITEDEISSFRRIMRE